MTDIPTTAEGIQRIIDRSGHMWPDELLKLGQVAVLTLKLMDQANFEKSPAIVALSKAALLAFAEAYAKHTGGK